MHGLLLTILLVLTGCGSPVAREPAQRPSTQNTESGSTVQVKAKCDGGSFTGSGVVIKQGVVATARHVVSENCTYKVDGMTAHDKKLHPVADAALLFVDTGSRPAAQLGTAHIGDRVTVRGYPHDMRLGKTKFTVTEGIVATTYEDVYRMTAHILPGSSGGPVFNKRGAVVGVVSSYRCYRHYMSSCMPYDGHYYFVPAKFLLTL